MCKHACKGLIYSKGKMFFAEIEVLFTSEQSGQMWNTCVWDTYSGTTLSTYKGGITGHKGMAILGGEYLMGASSTKPLIQVWSLNRKDQSQMKMVVPGRINCLAVTQDGSYCIGAVNEYIHIWQISTGYIVATVCRHYQKINIIRFTDNDSHFVTGADDNIAIVWSLSSVIANAQNKVNKPEPVYIWSSHSLPITDIHVGAGGYRCRVITASLDQSCKVWDLVSGVLLKTIVFPSSILSVVIDLSEHRLYAGGERGDIYFVHMYAQQKSSNTATVSDENNISVFKGHSQKVTCLSISMDGTKLASGSHDCTVKLWEVMSGQCVLTLNHKGLRFGFHDCTVKLWEVMSGQCVLTLNHKGQVTNILMQTTPPALLSTDWSTQMSLQQFKSLREESPSSILINTKIHFSKDMCTSQTDKVEVLQVEARETIKQSHVNNAAVKSHLNKIIEILR